MLRGIIGVVASLWCVVLLGQDLSKAEMFSSDSLSKYTYSSSVYPKWIDGWDNMFYYDFNSGEGRKFYIVEPSKGTKKEIFDNAELAQSLKAITGEEYNPQELKLYTLDFDKKHSEIFRFDMSKKRFEYNIKTKKLKEVPLEVKKSEFTKSKEPYWKRFCTDSTYYIYAFRHDLYLKSRSSTDSVRLTFDGEPYFSFETGGSNKAETSDRLTSPIGYWIGDSYKYVIVREDKRKVGTMTVINSLNKPRPDVKTYKFPIPGDSSVVEYDMFVVDAKAAIVNRLNVAKYPDQKIEIPRFGIINRDSEYVYFIRRNRTCDRIDLCRLTLSSGDVKELITEENKPHFNDQLFAYHIVGKDNDIIWWSERTGKGQYYLYDNQGRLKNRITKGDFVAGKIEQIDTLARSVIFEGYGGDKAINPHYRLYYKADFGGKSTTCITPGNGHHSVQISPKGDYIVDTYSRMDAAPVSEVRSPKGRKLLDLNQSNLSKLYAAGWKAPKVINVKSADGITDLYGVMYLPFDIDSTRKYPIISNVYPGPQDDQVPQQFSIDDNYNQSLAQLGFVVINVAYRGSGPYRGRDFHCYGYGNLRDYALADDIAVIKQLAERHSFIDTTRVGIYGHSGGGFMTAAAMFTSPDFYKVGFSASGNHDNNIYTQWWGETYHGVKFNGEKFESKIPTTTTTEMAANLKGKLMLVTGDVDNNVHPASTLRLVDALIKAGKRFDMMILPGQDHGLGGKYYTNMIRYYFVENLK